MIYLKKFETTAEYEGYITGDTKVLPNVSICDDDTETVYYNPMETGPEYVDLGLSVKWLKHPIGMTGETDVENALYFAWGAKTGCTAADTDTDHSNDWAHAPFNNGSSDYNGAYWKTVSASVLDNRITLKAEYDAANVILGANWRLPNENQLRELVNETTQIVETINGVKGMRFTSKTNGNSLFIPFIGFRRGSSVYDVGDYVYLWSSSLYVLTPDRAVELEAYGDGNSFVGYYDRCFGYGVLGVID